MPTTSSSVDVNVPRFNQAAIALLTGVGFVLNQPVLVFASLAILFVSRFFGPRYAPLTQIYVRFIRPRFPAPIQTEDSRAPAFAQMLGTVMLGMATIAFLAGQPVAGWLLSLIVTALAGLAATANICVGCLLYQRFLGPAHV